jgi:hypothetical protein
MEHLLSLVSLGLLVPMAIISIHRHAIFVLLNVYLVLVQVLVHHVLLVTTYQVIDVYLNVEMAPDKTMNNVMMATLLMEMDALHYAKLNQAMSANYNKVDLMSVTAILYWTQHYGQTTGAKYKSTSFHKYTTVLHLLPSQTTLQPSVLRY